MALENSTWIPPRRKGSQLFHPRLPLILCLSSGHTSGLSRSIGLQRSAVMSFDQMPEHLIQIKEYLGCKPFSDNGQSLYICSE